MARRQQFTIHAFIIRPCDATIFVSGKDFCAWGKFWVVFVSWPQRPGQTHAVVKRNKTAGAPKPDIPNATYFGCVQDIHKRIRVFTTKTDCEYLWHVVIIMLGNAHIINCQSRLIPQESPRAAYLAQNTDASLYCFL